MGKMQFVRAEGLGFLDSRTFLETDPNVQGSDSRDDFRQVDYSYHIEQIEERDEGVDGTAVKMYFPGGIDELQMFEVRMDPGLNVPTHCHMEDEIMYVTSGEMTFGSQTLHAGDAVLIPAKTLYAIKVGDEGATFINFRARLDFGRMLKDEFVAARERGEL